MTTRTEQQRAVVVAERRIVGIGGNGVRRGFLLGEGDVVLDAILLGERVSLLCYFGLEKFHVLVRDGEMDMRLTIRGGIEGTLHEVFLHRGARSLGVLVEE